MDIIFQPGYSTVENRVSEGILREYKSVNNDYLISKEITVRDGKHVIRFTTVPGRVIEAVFDERGAREAWNGITVALAANRQFVIISPLSV